MVRTELREHIFKMLFQIEFNTLEEMPKHLELYFEELTSAKEKDKEYIQKKLEAVIEKLEEIDAILNEKATGWKTSRMNKVDLAILRLAVYEIKWDDDVPVKVAINEAVELAKKIQRGRRSCIRKRSTCQDCRLKMAGRTDAEECLHSKTGQCLYQEYVYTGFYAEPAVRQRGSVQL